MNKKPKPAEKADKPAGNAEKAEEKSQKKDKVPEIPKEPRDLTQVFIGKKPLHIYSDLAAAKLAAHDVVTVTATKHHIDKLISIVELFHVYGALVPKDSVIVVSVHTKGYLLYTATLARK